MEGGRMEGGEEEGGENEKGRVRERQRSKKAGRQKNKSLLTWTYKC